jgi:hypothetical protein
LRPNSGSEDATQNTRDDEREGQKADEFAWKTIRFDSGIHNSDLVAISIGSALKTKIVCRRNFNTQAGNEFFNKKYFYLHHRRVAAYEKTIPFISP